MASEAEIDEVRRMCKVLFLELQDMRRRLDIEDLGLTDSKDVRALIERDLKRFDQRIRSLR